MLSDKELQDQRHILKEYCEKTVRDVMPSDRQNPGPYQIVVLSYGRGMEMLQVVEGFENLNNVVVTIFEKDQKVFKQLREVIGNRNINAYNGDHTMLARFIGGLSNRRNQFGMLLIDPSSHLVDWVFIAELFQLNKCLYRFDIMIRFSAGMHKRHQNWERSTRIVKRPSEYMADISKALWFHTKSYEAEQQCVTLVGTQLKASLAKDILFPVDQQGEQWKRIDNTYEELEIMACDM